MADQEDARLGQQMPSVSNNSTAILPWLIEHYELSKQVADLLRQRNAIGLQRYGTVLMSYNGRDALQDAIEEIADSIQYLAQVVIESYDRQRKLAFMRIIAKQNETLSYLLQLQSNDRQAI